ncbi:c-type cytochrome [Sediminibacterium soli]|uniref:c-type cytochrome n=1 Tax=Sediminibacterium soli TaxID=2698829 RepID=UPI001379F718|nr:c-type cytochrome [Sediminibacterium soli]NCI46968.1 cytochrome c [Sediminibacterium soli]
MKKTIGGLVLLIALAGLQSFKGKPVQAPKPAAIGKATMDRGKRIYTQRCLVCHQVDGGGVPHLNAPLDGASLVQGNDKTKLVRIILKGYSDRVEIDGEYYSNNMTPLADLNDQQISDVLTYVRNSWSNRASAITPAEVKAVRAKTK